MRGIGGIIGERRPDPARQPVERSGRGRSDSFQRLQVGLSGLIGIVLVLALADVITDRANRTEAGSVPEAAATVSAGPVVHSQQNDPLAEAGVVPDPKASATATPGPVVPMPPTPEADDAIPPQ